MNATKHTPGPWAVQDCRSELVIHHDKFDVAIVGIDPTYEYNLEQRANAKLIAAAPDLADATRDLLKAFRDCIGAAAFREFEQSNTAVRAAYRARAKAGL